MSTESPEQRFARWRESGDPADLGAVFDALAPRLLGLALHLCTEPADAEDVLQQTFLVAMTKAATWDEARPLAPWLGGILSLEAARAKERSSRAPEPARLLKRTADVPAEFARASEAVEILRTRAAELPADTRALLLLRLEHELSPAEIAEVLDRPPGTVRVQLQRALARLRRIWPASLTLSFGVSALPTRGLAAVRHAVLAEASSSTAPMATGAGFLGWLVMKKALAFAAALVVVGSFAWWALREGDAPLEKRGSIAEPQISRAGQPEKDGELVARTQLASTESTKPEENVQRSRSAALALEIVWARDGSPAADVGLVLELELGSSSRLHRRAARTDVEGRASFAGLAPGQYRVELDRHSRCPRIQLTAGGSRSERIEIPAGVEVRGVVLAPGGVRVADAEIHLCGIPDYTFGRLVARSDSAGEFQVAEVEAGSALTASASEWRGSNFVKVPASPSGVYHAELYFEQPGCAVEGTVCDAHGSPVEGAEIVVSHTFRKIGPLLELPTEERNKAGLAALAPRMVGTARSDAQGRFRVLGIWRGGHLTVWASAPGFAPAGQELDLPERGLVPPLHIALGVGASIEGTLRDSAGQPVAQAAVDISPIEFLGPRHTQWDTPDWIQRTATSAQNGSFRMEHLPLGEFIVRAQRAPMHAKATLRASEGELLRWDPVLSEGLSIRGVVLDRDGNPASGLAVKAQSPRGPGRALHDPLQVDSLEPATTDAAGRFEIRRCEELPLDLQVRHPSDPFGRILASHANALPGGPDVEMRVGKETTPSSSIFGRVIDATGNPLAAHITVRSDGTASLEADASDEGQFELGPLVPGTYRLSVKPSKGDRSLSCLFGPYVLAGTPRVDAGDLRIERGATLEISIAGDAFDSPMARISLLNLRVGQQWSVGNTDERGSFRLEGMQPGEYFVWAGRGSNLITRSQRVRLEPDVTTSVQLSTSGTSLVKVRAPHPETGRFERIRLEVFGSTGELEHRQEYHADSHALPRLQQFVRLAPGSYRIRIESASGWSGESAVVVPVGASEPIEVDLELKRDH